MPRADFAQVEDIDNALVEFDTPDQVVGKKPFAEFEFEDVEVESYVMEDLQFSDGLDF